MMNKIKSARVQLLKSLFVLPVIAVLLLAFRSQIHDAKPKGLRNRIDSLPNNIPDKYDDISLHRSDAMDEMHKAFFDRNPEIQLLHWKKNGVLEIYLTKNRVEKYLNDEYKNAEVKYGKLPSVTEGSHSEVFLIRDTVPEQTVPNDKGYFIEIKKRNGHSTVIVKDKEKKNGQRDRSPEME